MCEDKFQSMAEREMQKALKDGSLSNLKLKGKKISYRPDLWTPEDLRVEYQVFKSQGMLPPSVQAKVDIEEMKKELAENKDLTEDQRKELEKKLSLAEVQLQVKLDMLKRK